MSSCDRFLKRGLDLIVSVIGLLVCWPIILVAVLIARLDTGESGLFRQERVGRYGKPFYVTKIRTMRSQPGTTITAANDARITRIGALLRKAKIDELPQLWNVALGEMSLVGPRPDVPGYADRLHDNDRKILEMRPGITGPATLKYRDEETLLAKQSDPIKFNDTKIWPDKVKINRDYIENYSFISDLKYLWQTVFRR